MGWGDWGKEMRGSGSDSLLRGLNPWGRRGWADKHKVTWGTGRQAGY